MHLDWELPLEVYSEALVTGVWPVMPVYDLPADFADHLLAQRVLVSGFLRARSSQLSAIPKTAVDRGKAFPTPRTWDYAARLVALARAVGAPDAVVRLLVAGCVGSAAAHEFLFWSLAQDLPDSRAILADPTGPWFTGERPDHVYVVLQGVVGAASQDGTPDAWTAATVACCTAAEQVGVDPAVPAIRALLRNRPRDAALPPAITVFGSVLALAGLLPGAGAGGAGSGAGRAARR